jgi:hypothetical protein
MDNAFIESITKDAALVTELGSVEQRKNAIRAFCQLRPSDMDVPAAVNKKLRFAPSDVCDEMVLLLTSMGNPIGNLFVTGYAKPFHKLSQYHQERALLALASHPVPLVRKGFRALKSLTLMVYMNMPNNPNWKAVGYGGPQVDFINRAPYKHGYNMLHVDRDTEMEVDVVIVGSGCGGGVMAAELSAAGLRVVVLEKGSFVKSEDMHQLEVGMR